MSSEIVEPTSNNPLMSSYSQYEPLDHKSLQVYSYSLDNILSSYLF